MYFRPAAATLLIIAWTSTLASVALSQVNPTAEASGDTGIRAADPSVTHTADGYVAVEARSGRALVVRVAQSLKQLAETQPVRIWFDRERLGEVWAPEIVFQNGRYVIYFAAGVGSDHRMYKIDSEDPAGDYSDATEVLLPEDKWAIDGVSFTYRGADYFVWSGWQGDVDVQQDIFIARSNPGDAVKAPRILIGSPDQSWENIERETPSINEGPQPILDPAGQLHIVYSTNGSWGPNYCLADLRLKAGGDPLDRAAWFDSGGCLFGANEETLAEGTDATRGAKGVGHHSFILKNSELEQDDALNGQMPFLYHGVPAQETPENFWAARKWFIGSYQWLSNVNYGVSGSSDTGWSLRFSE
jgi:GH43 family beta-xylosidase